jgi:ABC-2 type transport system ATP-binding protein
MIGLIGENGAGKSTVIKAILGLLPYFKGKTEFANLTPNFAYIPEQPIYYEYLTQWEHLELLASV